MKESYLPMIERPSAQNKSTNTLNDILGDAAFLSIIVTICLPDLHWALSLTLVLTLFAASQILRFRKLLATQWRRLT